MSEEPKSAQAWLLPAIHPKHGGCGNCPPTAQTLAMHALIAVGFGVAQRTMDGVVVIDEMNSANLRSVSEAEAMAAADPDHDWRIDLQGPLRGRTYQRHGPEMWVLVDQNEGFA